MKKMDIYDFADHVSMIAKDFAHYEQNTYPAEDVSINYSLIISELATGF